jgi:hypothetical protein
LRLSLDEVLSARSQSFATERFGTFAERKRIQAVVGHGVGCTLLPAAVLEVKIIKQ